ncbi:MAG: conjugal transfer protein TraD [Alphaproteobacteria bacterium]|nr:conjugal transfer protein TraD [Alphaproteobacteria bacterium]
MRKTNLAEKRKKLEQRKNRLKQLEATLNVQERKNRTRRLIELGGLVSKAQLENWNANALLGGLLSLKEKEMDASQMNTWTHKGGVAFSSNNSKSSER